MTIFYYQIGYYTEEESDFTVLTHTKQFSEQDISVMVQEAIAALYPELDAIRKQRASFFPISFKDVYHGNSGIGSTKNLIYWLIDNKGFQRLKYTSKWRTFGWADVLDEKEWYDYRFNHEDPMIEVTLNLKKDPKMKEYVNRTRV
jgi:hypothetical protein